MKTLYKIAFIGILTGTLLACATNPQVIKVNHVYTQETVREIWIPMVPNTERSIFNPPINYNPEN